MKKFLVITGVGRDRPGLIHRISQGIASNGGNIELQRSARMAGEFALIALASFESDEGDASPVIEKLTGLSNDTFQINVREAVGWSEAPSDSLKVKLTANGEDRVGLIETVTLSLLQMNINILTMDVDVAPGAMTGVSMVELEAEVNVPSDVDIDQFYKELSDLEQDLSITLTAELDRDR